MYEVGWWKDLDGNFWLLGGWKSPGDYATPLWKYDIANNEWTWMKGPQTSGTAGVYGTQGVPDPANFPGSRCAGIGAWTDDNGDLWMYGGLGYDASGTNGSLSDMWKYNIATNEWTWINGSKYTSEQPVFGTYQTFGATVTPGQRGETTCSWKDAAGNFWVYGGFDNGGNSSAMFKYDPTLNQWAWMWGGSAFMFPNYGTQGIASATNSPGSRYCYGHWQDAQGHMWISGGYGNNYYSDVWMYDPSVSEWTWQAGTNLPNVTSYFGTKCDTSGNYFPASRWENSASWTDHAGNFWLIGGQENTCCAQAHNDLWVFQPGNMRWIWINGDSTAQLLGFYGTQGIASAANKPTTRFGAASWTDCNDNLWLFGGIMQNGPFLFQNDLWKFTIDPGCVPGYQSINCSQSPVNFSAANQTLCEKFCTSFFDSSLNNPTAWQWNFPGGAPSSSTDQNPANICYTVPGVYDVTLIVTTANGNDTLTLANYITVNPTPPFPTITQAGYTLTSSVSTSYQWQLNSVDIPGATNQSYTILQTGYYTVVVGDANGCVNSATLYVLITGIDEVNEAGISISPNPSDGAFMVEWLNGLMADEISIEVVNALGQIVFSSSQSRSSGALDWKKEIDLRNAARGIYFIEIKTNQQFLRKKILIQ